MSVPRQNLRRRRASDETSLAAVEKEYGGGRPLLCGDHVSPLFDDDALGDALLALVEAQAKGVEIKNPGGWVRVVARREAQRAMKNRRVEAEAMGKVIQARERGLPADAYGKEETPRSGEDYREYIRRQQRASEAKRRARKRREREEATA